MEKNDSAKFSAKRILLSQFDRLEKMPTSQTKRILHNTMGGDGSNLLANQLRAIDP